MQAIMMYMSGNSLQIFSIMMVLMLFKGPIQGLINTNAAFAKYETPSTRARLVGVKAVYVLMQLLLLALGVWKVNGMGLLPYVPMIDCPCCCYILIHSTEPRDRIGSHGNRSASLWNKPFSHSSDIYPRYRSDCSIKYKLFLAINGHILSWYLMMRVISLLCRGFTKISDVYHSFITALRTKWQGSSSSAGVEYLIESSHFQHSLPLGASLPLLSAGGLRAMQDPDGSPIAVEEM